MREHRRTIRMMPGAAGPSLSMLEGWAPYRWRDPARCSPDRLAELDAHDAHIAAIERLWGRQWQPHRTRRLI